jgi:hypothetical protein
MFFLLASSAFAWGEAGHYMVNDAATRGLPNDMPPFFYAAFPELVHLAYDPDRLKGAGESLDAVNPPDHFLDYEFVSGLKLPPDRYRFIALLGSSGTLRRHAIYNSTTGFLPWKIAELEETLTDLFRFWRASAPGSPERAFIEHDIIHNAGILGHFVGDASQPLHATVNFNGWTDPNPAGYAYDCETHSRFETAFVSRSLTVDDVIPKVAAPVLRSNYFSTAIEMIKDSNRFVEPLYKLDRDGGFNYFGPPSPAGKAFASDRIAAGASMLRDFWWSAWRNSAQPVRKARGAAVTQD